MQVVNSNLGSFLRRAGEDTNLLFNYFKVSNERIRETGMRNSAVKCGEKTVSYREGDMRNSTS